MMTVHYETLTANVGGLLPEILQFCGLEPATLTGDALPSDIPVGARAGQWVNTANYNSVIEPVHQRAIARWKHFEPFLGPEFETLAPCAARLNNDSAPE